MTFAELLAHPEVDEVCELRGDVGFMAFHGGGLEEMTDVIARAAAERCGASYYGVHQPASLRWHIPSAMVTPAASTRLAAFVAHVRVVVTVHGFGRRGLASSVLLGGQNRRLARHLGEQLRQSLPTYDIVADIDRIPADLRGVHPENPVNLPPEQGVQLELPHRVRGSSPLWPGSARGRLTQHGQALVDGLAVAAGTF